VGLKLKPHQKLLLFNIKKWKNDEGNHREKDELSCRRLVFFLCDQKLKYQQNHIKKCQMLRQPSNHLRNCHQIESPKLPAFFFCQLSCNAWLTWLAGGIFSFLLSSFMAFAGWLLFGKPLLSSACGKLENQSLLLQHLGQNLVAALL